MPFLNRTTINFLGASLASASNMAMTGCSFVLLNLFMQHVLHFSAMASGLGMMPFAFGAIVASHFIRRGLSTYPMRLTMMFGFLICIIGFMLLAMASAGRGYALNLVPGETLVGLGAPIAMVLLMALATASIPPQVQGVATGVLMTIQQIGLAMGVSAGLTVVSSSMKAGDTAMTAFHHGFYAASVIALIGLLSTLFFTRTVAKTATMPGAGPEIMV